MAEKKNSLDKKFRTPFGNDDDLVFDGFTKTTKETKVGSGNDEEKEGDEIEEVVDEVEEPKGPVRKKTVVKSAQKAEASPAKYSNFEDYANYPNRGEGTKTKTFTLDSVSEAKLNSISIALDTSLRVFFSNVIDEFYEKHEKEIKKRVRNKYGV